MSGEAFPYPLPNLISGLGRDGFRTFAGLMFDASGDLQASFPNRAAYVGYLTAIAEGRVRLKSNEVAPVPANVAKAALDQVIKEQCFEERLLGAENTDMGRDLTAWRQSASLRGEFPSFEAYVAYRQAQRAGRIRTA